MSKEQIQIRFDGEALEGHSIDVSVVAPALSAIGNLISDCNRYVNGDDIRVQVKLHADLKANCVTLLLDVHWESLIQHVKGLLENADVKNAKELLEWIGIIAGTGTAGSVTLFKVVKWLYQRKKNNEITIVKRNGDKILLSVKDKDEKIEMQESMYRAAISENIQESIKNTLKPNLSEGIEKTTFIHKGVENSYNEEDANDYKDVLNLELDPEAEEQEIVGHIVIHAPVFEKNSKKWKFKWNNKVEPIDISETNISEMILNRGKVAIGDAFRVKLSMIEKKQKRGYKQFYKVKEVLEFIPNNYEQAEIIWAKEDEFEES